MVPVVATLVIGILVGFLAQRSRFCSVGAFRNYFLSRDTYLLKGYLGVLIGGTAGFLGFKLAGGAVPHFPLGMDLPATASLMVLIVGGMGMGFFSVLAGGCPLRMHVMATEGKETAVFYLVGFYTGIVYFYLFIFDILKLIAPG